jgi:hypothetical protein
MLVFKQLFTFKSVLFHYPIIENYGHTERYHFSSDFYGAARSGNNKLECLRVAKYLNFVL